MPMAVYSPLRPASVILVDQLPLLWQLPMQPAVTIMELSPLVLSRVALRLILILLMVLRSPQHLFTTTFPEDRILSCLLYTSDAADERSSVDLGGRRIIK